MPQSQRLSENKHRAVRHVYFYRDKQRVASAAYWLRMQEHEGWREHLVQRRYAVFKRIAYGYKRW